jgi:riboflavin synthase
VFSGIVEEVGRVGQVKDQPGGRRFVIESPGIVCDLKLGDSISVSGCCLTAVDFGADWFAVEATPETLRRTTLGSFRPGSRVNLERALRVSDRLGGHIVSGHVDAVATVSSQITEGISKVVGFRAPRELASFFIEKGSVTIDGVSLTVASLSSERGSVAFGVALIPHTMKITTLGTLKVGDQVNIEADVIGKYVARLVELGLVPNINKPGVSLALLNEHGYT